MDFLFTEVIIYIKEKGYPMPRKKTVKKTQKKQAKPIEFADGKDHLKEESVEARNLEEILGNNEPSPFGTSNASEFESSLDGMSITEMQELAVNAGVFPSGTKLTLKNKLTKAFKQYSLGSNNVVQVTKPIVDPESPEGKALLGLIKNQ